MKEQEIRPPQIFEEYLRLAIADSDLYFGQSRREAIPCPACLTVGEKSFDKHGFSYEVCPSCNTLFVSPRPPVDDFFSYYKNSASARYFATTFYQATAEARRVKLWRPKARRVLEILQELGACKSTVYDIGGGYGIFAEEYFELSGIPVTVIEPGPESANICRGKGLSVVELFLEEVLPTDLVPGPKVFTSFELFEHLHDCRKFLKCMAQLMSSGDIFIFTTLSGTGVDIQTLWENSNSISLQHLNFFNPDSIVLLLEGQGMRPLFINTPGQLDMEIMSMHREKIKDRFWQTLLKFSSPDDLQNWQDFIVDSRCSSHMLVVCELI